MRISALDMQWEIILSTFKLENYFQFPGAVENDQEVKRCSWKNCYFVEVVRWNQEEEKRHHHQGGDGGEEGGEEL